MPPPARYKPKGSTPFRLKNSPAPRKAVAARYARTTRPAGPTQFCSKAYLRKKPRPRTVMAMPTNNSHFCPNWTSTIRFIEEKESGKGRNDIAGEDVGVGGSS